MLQFWPFKPYKLMATLPGHRDAALSLSFSPDCKFLVVCGYDSVTIYDLSTLSCVTTPDIPSRSTDSKHIFQRSCWLHFENGDRHVVVLGSLRGDILLWEWNDEDRRFDPLCQRDAEGPEGMVLSVDAYAPRGSVYEGLGRIVVSTENRYVFVFSLSPGSPELEVVFQKRLGTGLVGKTVKFLNRTRDIIVFSRYGGKILRLHHQTGELLSTDFGPYIMGAVCLDEENDCMIAWTGTNTFDVFRFSTMTNIRTLDAGSSLVAFPKHISFVQKGKYVVAGTDRGYAVLFDPISGKKIQRLVYPRGGLVQHVAASDQPNGQLIAIAGSAPQQISDVLIFRRGSPQALRTLPTERHKPGSFTITLDPDRLWQYIAGTLAAMFIALVGYVYRDVTLRSKVVNGLIHWIQRALLENE